MTVDQLISQRVRALPPEKQAEVLAFVDFLAQYRLPREALPRHSPKGLWADLQIDFSEELLTEARQEMWGNFPREIEL